MKKTKIICSIGPASAKYEVMKKMIENGMNVARINFSHATIEERENVQNLVKQINEDINSHVAILYDTKGPDFRTGIVENGSLELVEGENIRIVKEDVIGNKERITFNYKEAIDDIEVGNTILLEDGLMKLIAVSKDETGINCDIVVGGILGDRKGVNVPGTKLNVPFISDQDREDIIYASQNNGDFLALSFVNTKEDVLTVKEILAKENNSHLQLIAKIESKSGIDNLDEIIEVSDGIMIARGDLGVEMPMHELPILQKKIAKKCREAGKICIVATEMLESMKKNARPTRAEVSDISNAVFDGTDAVMLSGETTMGRYPAEAVKYMADICKSTENNLDYAKQITCLTMTDITSAIATSVVNSSNMLDVKLIVVPTSTGYTAKKISSLRSKPSVLACVLTSEYAKSLALNFGVYSTIINKCNTTEELVSSSLEISKQVMNLNCGELVVVTGSFKNDKNKTDFMKIQEV